MNAMKAYDIQDFIFGHSSMVCYYLDNKEFEKANIELAEYIDAISELMNNEEEIIKLFDLIRVKDQLGIINNYPEGDPNDITGYAQYSLKLLVDMYPEVLSRKYKKLLFEFKLVGGISNVDKNITNL